MRLLFETAPPTCGLFHELCIFSIALVRSLRRFIGKRQMCSGKQLAFCPMVGVVVTWGHHWDMATSLCSLIVILTTL